MDTYFNVKKETEMYVFVEQEDGELRFYFGVDPDTPFLTIYEEGTFNFDSRVLEDEGLDSCN